MVEIVREALSFDDVTFLPADSTNISPDEVDLTSECIRGIELGLPLISAAMDTVTEANMAAAMALNAGAGAIHFALPPSLQAKEVDRVKRRCARYIDKPFCVHPGQTVADVQVLQEQRGVGTFPVTSPDDHLLGYSTKGKRFFCLKPGKTDITKAMIPYRHGDLESPLVVCRVGMDADAAFNFMFEREIKFLLIVDDEGKLHGMYSGRDLKETRVKEFTKDKSGRLRVIGAIGVDKDNMMRASLLVEKGVDALLVDSAKGNRPVILQTVAECKRRWDDDIKVIAGNVATGGAALNLIDAGTDAVKVGIGGGSICTTRYVTGVGPPTLDALIDVSKAIQGKVPIIVDGGIRGSGDLAKAFAFGADGAMIGRLVAGTDESAGKIFSFEGRRYKPYRGMGSLGAMQEGIDRGYVSKAVVPQGIEGAVPYCGALAQQLQMIAGGVREAFANIGATNIATLRELARLVRVTERGVEEGRVHDVVIMKEAPNYR